jgi:hypothetical protein
MRAEKWLAAQVGAEGARIFTEEPFNCAETVILSLVKGG